MVHEPGLEDDRVDVDARHLHANIGAVADLVERVTPIDPLYRRCLHGLVDHVRRRFLGVDDVAIVGNVHDRRRRVDIEAADRPRIAVAVVDDDDLAPAGVPADSPQQPTVRTDHGDDLAAIGTDHDRAGLAADGVGADVAGAIAEAIEVVAADVGLPARIADDDAIRFGVDGAAAFDGLASLVVRSAMVAPITAPATTPAPIASGVRSRCGGRGGGGSGATTVGPARKAGVTVGGANCARLGGGVAAAEPGTVLGAAAPAGGAAAGAERRPGAAQPEFRLRARPREAFRPVDQGSASRRAVPGAGVGPAPDGRAAASERHRGPAWPLERAPPGAGVGDPAAGGVPGRPPGGGVPGVQSAVRRACARCRRCRRRRCCRRSRRGGRCSRARAGRRRGR